MELKTVKYYIENNKKELKKDLRKRTAKEIASSILQNIVEEETRMNLNIVMSELADIYLENLDEKLAEQEGPHFLEAEEFYNLCQKYRHTPRDDFQGVIASFENLKKFIKGKING